MKLKKFPELLSFFIVHLSNGEQDTDETASLAFLKASAPEKVQVLVSQIKSLISAGDLPLDEFGSEANRWFENHADAEKWLKQLVTALGPVTESNASFVVKDSNGTLLRDGDSVQVIKDLKVKGGSSDLKRGTLIKKIHLIDDPENVECRVDGSTLVLKTMFLKKS